MAEINIEKMAQNVAEKALDEFLYQGKSIREWMQIIVSEEYISRQAVIDILNDKRNIFSDANDAIQESIDTIEALRPVISKPKTGYISIDDVMSVFDDFMCGKVDENETETFLEMLKDKADKEE